MKGVIFNLLEDVVRDEQGDDFWDNVVEVSGASGAYTSLGTYSVGELTAQRERLAAYLLQARYALATLYDRAANGEPAKPRARSDSAGDAP